jgi:hypothetical protein
VLSLVVYVLFLSQKRTNQRARYPWYHALGCTIPEEDREGYPLVTSRTNHTVAASGGSGRKPEGYIQTNHTAAVLADCPTNAVLFEPFDVPFLRKVGKATRW